MGHTVMLLNSTTADVWQPTPAIAVTGQVSTATYTRSAIAIPCDIQALGAPAARELGLDVSIQRAHAMVETVYLSAFVINSILRDLTTNFYWAVEGAPVLRNILGFWELALVQLLAPPSTLLIYYGN